MSNEHELITKPLPPILCYPGGKSRLARILLAGQWIPPHRIYVEPFFGGGSVFFAKPLAEVNVINDIDKRLMSFYEKFRELPVLDCDMQPDEEKFYRLKEQLENGENLDPCDYLYLNKWSLNCMMERFSKTKKKCQSRTCQLSKLLKYFEQYKRKLSRAIILSKDFREVIREFDSPETFFFIDPPYYGPELRGAHGCRYTEYGGCGVSPQEVLETVRGVKGKFMITYPDLPELRKIFSDFYHSNIGWRYTSVVGERRPYVEELIITNYPPPRHESGHEPHELLW